VKNRLKEARLSFGLSKWKLHQLSGVSFSHISLVEKHERGISYEKALRITDALGVELEEVFPEFRKDVARAMR